MNFKTFKRKYLPHKTWNRWMWHLRGKPLPPPADVKQGIVGQYASRYGLRILIETGTYEGDMVEAVQKRFHTIHSIEIFEPLYKKAASKFSTLEHVHIHFGDSEKLLPEILEKISDPVLFWLDAHFSGEGTGRGAMDSPIMNELSFIFSHPVGNHVILIDDARLFVGESGYPTLEKLEEFIQINRPDLSFVVKDDIIRINKQS